MNPHAIPHPGNFAPSPGTRSTGEAFVTEYVRPQAGVSPLLLADNAKAEGGGQARTAAHQGLVSALNDYLHKTPVEHHRELVLKELGLTEERLMAQPAMERVAAEKEISRRINERLIHGNGQWVAPAATAAKPSESSHGNFLAGWLFSLWPKGVKN